MTPFATAETELAGPEQLHGCNAEDLMSALGEPLTRLQRFMPDADWLSDAEDLMSAAEHPVTDAVVGGSDHGPLCALAPIMSTLRGRISGALHEFDGHKSGLAVPVCVIDAFERALKYRLLNRILPSVIVDLHRAGAAGELAGNSSTERYDDFIRQIHSSDWRRAFFIRYPIIARTAATMGLHAVSSAVEFISRLYADWPLIQDEFGLLGNEEVCDIHVAGDLHDRFRAVLVLEFDSGSKLLYKPRPVETALHFQELIAWLNERGLEPRLRTMKVVDRAGYGWEEYVSSDAVYDEHQAKRFYERQGSLMALLYAVSASDVHSENIIAAGEHPVLVDHETLFQPEWPMNRGSRPETASRAFAASLVADALWYLALLPSRRYSRDGSPGIDSSGLGGGESGVGPLRAPTIINPGRDDMSMELRHVESSAQVNRPNLGGEVLSVHDFRSDLVSGFQGACRLLCE